MKTLMRCALGLIVLVAFSADESWGIPAFARKYDMSCTTCHAPFPKLKPFGDEFANNGYQLPGQEPPRAYRETGDDQLLLLRELPLAVRFEGYLTWLPDDPVDTDVQIPWVAKLLSGGTISRTVSYYFYFLMNEQGEIVGLEDAFVMFHHLFGSDLSVTVGQFQKSDPLFKRELRLTIEDYRIYSTAVGQSTVDLTYDRGVVLRYGLPTKTDVTLEITNGNGIGIADAQKRFDADKYKDVLLRVSQEIDASFRLGAFGYYGNEKQSGAVNAVWMAGPDLTLDLAPFQLSAQYLFREDDRPFFTSRGDLRQTRGGFAELIYAPGGDRSAWYGVLLYNRVTSDVPEAAYESATASADYMLARNVRLVGEYTYDLQHKTNRLSAGFVVAF